MSSTEADVERLAGAILHEAATPAIAPVDVDAVAQRLGLAVRRTRIAGPVHGLLRLEGGRPTVVVDSGLQRARARFTVAHEIGHWVLARHPQLVREVWSAQPWLREPERFCDRFAEALLLPSQWVRPQLLAMRPSLDALVWLAQTADVSLTAASVRAARIARWRRTLLRLAFGRQRWEIVAVTGYLRPRWREGVALTPQAAQRLGRLRGELRDRDEDTFKPAPIEQTLWMSLIVDRVASDVHVELRMARSSAVLLANLTRRGAPRPSVEAATLGDRAHSST
ncbi:MAG: hypothetical protein V7607_2648 [Solirubrobacteraceae bacterium]